MNWVRKLQDSLRDVDAVPKHFWTAAQFRAKNGISQATAARVIRRGLETGELVCRTFKIKAGLRGVYPTPHYARAKDLK